MNTESDNTDAGINGHAAAAPRNVAADAALATVSREFHNFVADVEDLIKATTSLTGEELAVVKARLSARVAAARNSIGEMGGAIAGQARHGARATNSYVHEQPWQAVAMGAGVGLLVGLVLGRRA